MKRAIIVVVMMIATIGVKAQDCMSIVLPSFGYDTVAFNRYPAEKVMYRCLYSQTSFYESDTIPAGAEMFNISEVREAYGTNHLSQSYVVDLTTLSYYAYNFREIQMLYPTGNITICFATPSSTHPYLVLRSIEDTYRLADEAYNEYYRGLGY